MKRPYQDLARCLLWSPLLALAIGGGAVLAQEQVCDLTDAADTELQHQLDEVVAGQGLDDAARRGDLAVGLLVLSEPGRPRLAEVNGNRMFYAASLPKIAILLAAAVELDEGQLSLDEALDRDINDMIRFSCNDCSNRVLEVVGPDRVTEILQSPRYAFYDAADGGGLWLGKGYGAVPAFRRDPVGGLSHAATTRQVTRFYCGLQQGTLVGPRGSDLMFEAMRDPGISHKFVKGLEGHREAQLFRKSGTWETFHADSALVRVGDQAYVIVGLAASEQGAAWLERLAEPLHRLALSLPSTPNP